MPYTDRARYAAYQKAYYRKRREERAARKPTLSERFWSKVRVTHECWLWIAGLDHYGYGQFHLDRKVVKAHRLAYELVIGPIPVGLDIDHVCRVRRCVNPWHMELVTRGENVRRGLKHRHLIGR